MDFEALELVADAHADFNNPILDAPKYAQEYFNDLRNWTTKSGAMNEYDYKKIKHDKLREMFIYNGIGYNLQWNHRFVQYWLQSEVLKHAYAEYNFRHYQTLWDKWVIQLPKVFKGYKGYLAAILPNGNVFSYSFSSDYTASRGYFNEYFYDFLQALESGMELADIRYITFMDSGAAHFLTNKYFCVARQVYNKNLRKNQYHLQEISVISMDKEIHHISDATQVIDILNKTL